MHQYVTPLTRQDVIMRRRAETSPLRPIPAAPGHLLPYINLFSDISELSIGLDEPLEKVNWMKEGF